MKLVGSKITKVNASRNPDFAGKLSMDSNIKVTDISDHTQEGSDMKMLKITAAYIINYGELGMIEIEGQLFVTGEEGNLEKIRKNFDEKDFNSPEMLGIMNITMQKFSIKAFSLEEELGLPIHIKLPSLKQKQE